MAIVRVCTFLAIVTCGSIHVKFKGKKPPTQIGGTWYDVLCNDRPWPGAMCSTALRVTA